MQVVHDAFEYVNCVSTEKFVLNPDFVSDANKYIHSSSLSEIVSLDNMNRAINLLVYFNKTKIILSGHTCTSITNSFIEMISDLVQSEGHNENKISTLEISLCRYILLDKRNELEKYSKSRIQQEKFKRIDKDTYNLLIQRLIDLKFIRIILKRNKHGPASEILERLVILELNIDQIGFLKNYQIEANDRFLKVGSINSLNKTLPLSENESEELSDNERQGNFIP